ncbi:TPA: hypothetical protein JZF90_004694, partial [Escherichia coli]|nr:hypothetical protein [Escherichia coli]
DGSIVYRQDDNGRTICRDNGDNIVLNRDPQSGVLGRSALKTVPLIFGRESERFEPDGNDPALLRSFGEIVAWHNRKDPQHIRIISRKDADDYRQAAVSRHQKRVEKSERDARNWQYVAEYLAEQLDREEQQQDGNAHGPTPVGHKGPGMGR